MNATPHPNERADTALSIATEFGPVFVVCWPNERGECACGAGHTGHDVGKAPIFIKGEQEHGALDATTDPAAIRRRWARFPQGSVGLALEVSRLVFVGPDTDAGRAEAQTRGLTPSVVRKSSNDGMLYRRTADTPITSAIGKGDSHGIDVKSNGYAVVYGRHQDGSDIYLEPCESLLAPVPPWANAILRSASSAGGTKPFPERIPVGERREHYISLVGTLRRRGLPESLIEACLQFVNQQMADEPWDDDELERLVRSSHVQPAVSPPGERSHAGCADPACAEEKAGLRDQISRFWRVKGNPNLPSAVADTALKMVHEAKSAARLVNGAPVIDADDWVPINLGNPSRTECEQRWEAKARGEDPGPAPRHGWAKALGRSPKTVRTQLTQLEEWGIATLRRAPARVGNRDVEIITGFRLNDTATATLDRLETLDPTTIGYTPPGRRPGLICPSCRDETKIVLEASATCADCDRVLAATKQTLKPDAPILRSLFPREIEIAERLAEQPPCPDDVVDLTTPTRPMEKVSTREAMVPDSIGKGFQWDGQTPTLWPDLDAGSQSPPLGPAPPDEGVPRFAEQLS